MTPARRTWTLALLTVLSITPAQGQNPPTDSAAVHATMLLFTDALNRLDLEGMSALFAADITAFVPTAQAGRADGRAAVVGIFRAFVAQAHARTLQPGIVPADLRVSASGGWGLASFQVRDTLTARVNRRTFVFRRTGESWRIVHFHASDVVPSP